MELVNGYLIVGALWWYLHTHQYPFDWIINPQAFPNSISSNLIAILPMSYLYPGPLAGDFGGGFLPSGDRRHSLNLDRYQIVFAGGLALLMQ